LREPTLLAQLPAHPNLIGVQGMKRTEGHFYLIGMFIPPFRGNVSTPALKLSIFEMGIT
jgi:hypothetical protein